MTSSGSTEKKPVDWIAVEADYKLGALSERSIADSYGISRALLVKRAKQGNWERDNAPKVKQALRKKLAVKALEEAGVRRHTQAAAIEITAENQANVVTRHRAQSRKYQALVEQLFGELSISTDHCGVIMDAVEKCAVSGVIDARGLRKAVDYLVRLPTRAVVAKDLVTAFARLVDIERRSHGIKDDEGEGSWEEQLDRLRSSIT